MTRILAKERAETVRLPFKWERLQLDLKGPLNQHDLNKMKELSELQRKTCANAIWCSSDLHNYCRRYMNNEHVIPLLIGNNGLTIGDLAFLASYR